jgi:hypothetical protein
MVTGCVNQDSLANSRDSTFPELFRINYVPGVLALDLPMTSSYRAILSSGLESIEINSRYDIQYLAGKIVSSLREVKSHSDLKNSIGIASILLDSLPEIIHHYFSDGIPQVLVKYFKTRPNTTQDFKSLFGITNFILRLMSSLENASDESELSSSKSTESLITLFNILFEAWTTDGFSSVFDFSVKNSKENDGSVYKYLILLNFYQIALRLSYKLLIS